MQFDDQAPDWGNDNEDRAPDRTAWVAILQVEEQRARRHGGVHGLILVRLEGSPDTRLAERAAAAIAGVIRDIDFLAQVDSRTFAMLALHCGDLTRLVSRLYGALEIAGVLSTTLIDARHAGPDLRATWSAMLTGVPNTPARRHTNYIARTPPSPN